MPEDKKDLERCFSIKENNKKNQNNLFKKEKMIERHKSNSKNKISDNIKEPSQD